MKPPPTDGPFAKVPPLASKKGDGTPYERTAATLASIVHFRALPESVRLAEVAGQPTEALVHFIRQEMPMNAVLFSRIVQEISRRGTEIARNVVHGIDRDNARLIAADVDTWILKLVLSREQSPYADFLEVAFGQAAQMWAFNALRNYLRSARLNRGEIEHLDDDGNEVRRPLELIADGGPSPEEILLKLRDRNERHRLLRIACQAVPDRRHLKAAILHWGYGWPVTSTDRQQPSLTRHFDVRDRQMWRWLDSAMMAMRVALMGEEKAQKLTRSMKGGAK